MFQKAVAVVEEASKSGSRETSSVIANFHNILIIIISSVRTRKRDNFGILEPK
jgi:hypothetical protein